MDQETNDIPAGFKQIEQGFGFIDALAPVYVDSGGDYPRVAIRVEDQHCNMMGMCHGGVIMTLLDVGLSSVLRTEIAKEHGNRGNPTISQNTDFVSAARLGDWIQFELTAMDVKRLFGYISGELKVGERCVARASAICYLPAEGFELSTKGLAVTE